jgi:Flp pilus assembly protein TadD
VTKGEIGDLGVRSDNLLPLYQYLITEFNVIVFVYLKLFFHPINQNLDYDFPVSRSFLDSAPAFFILTSLLAAGVALHRRNRVASIGIILFFLTASVESSFFVLEDLVFEHRIYLPMAGLLAAMASVMRLGLEKAPANAGRAVAVLIILAVCVPLSIATGRRNLAWSSARGLMADVVAKSPRKVRGYNNLAAVIQSEGDADLALATLYKAKDINPRDPFTLMNIGRGLEKKGDIEALKYYLRAVSINPQLPGAAFELGDLLFRLKKFDGAAKYFTLAHNLKPWDIPTRMNLGVALYHGGRLKDAVRVFTSVLKMKPDQAEAHFNLSQAYLGLGETAKAEEHLSKATALGYTKPEPEK